MKRGPLYELQTAAGATFVEREGWQVPEVFESASDEWRALKETIGLADLTSWGVLRLAGSSRLDFVQRMSTNDVLGLKPGQGAPTVFTTPIGRIVDLAFVLVREENLLLLVGRGADELVANWLQRHVFFNDDVVVENLTGQRALLGCSGPKADQLIEQLAGQEMQELPPFHLRVGQIAGVDVTVVRAVPLGNEYALLANADQAPALWTALVTAVQEAGGAPVGEAALETARIGAGQPRYGWELNEDYIPLEAGLKWAVSFSKGCYVGQEIIARLDTYQRLAKRLAVLQVAGEQGASAGDEVRADGAKAGQLTSVTPLAGGGTVKALAYVKSGVAEPGRELTIVGRDGMLTAIVLTLPGE